MLSRFFPPDYSGAGLQALALARELRRLGHQIEFVALKRSGLRPLSYQEGFHVTRLEAGRGARHREFRYWWNLIRFLNGRRGEFDLLHSHGIYYTDAIIGLLGPLYGAKTLAKASLAKNDLHSVGNSLYGRLHRSLLRRIDACIAISRELEQELLDAGAKRNRTYFFPNGVDTERFRPADNSEKRALRQALGLPVDQLIALYVGVFDARKNIEWLMKQWETGGAFGTDAMLVAVGPRSRDDTDGRFRQSLVDFAAGSPKRLCVLDHSDTIETYYRAADLFLLPSVREGLPNALLEAMACGLPVVAADASGSRELVRTGETGSLFTIDDPASLSRAVQSALGESAPQLGRAAREMVIRHYSLANLARRYEALYADLMNRLE